jgi:cytidylate kinase
MASLLIVTGPPGAGKSTVAALIADSTPRSVLVPGDAFFGFLANGAIDPWLPESHEQNTVVTRAAGKAVGEFVAGGFSVVYDGVIGPWFLDTFITTAGLTEVDYAALLPTAEVCQRRVATRVGHGFTDLAATASMHRQFSEARHRRDRHPVLGTPDAWRVGLGEHPNRAGIERPPPAPSLAEVITRTALVAPSATPPAALAESAPDHDLTGVFIKLDALDHHPMFDAEHARPYPLRLHPVAPLSLTCLRQPESQAGQRGAPADGQLLTHGTGRRATFFRAPIPTLAC